jgi:hypothetical protein
MAMRNLLTNTVRDILVLDKEIAHLWQQMVDLLFMPYWPMLPWPRSMQSWWLRLRPEWS